MYNNKLNERGSITPQALAELGSKWIKENKYLALKVPSVIVKGEWNILLNPNHVSFKK